MKTMKILLAGLIFIIMTACSSNPDDWEEGVLDIDYGQKATTGLFYKINIDGPIKKTFERKSGDDNIHERVSAGNYTIYVTAYSDPEYKTVYAVGSGVAEVKAGEFINVSVIPITTSSVKVITAFTFLTTPVSIGIIDEEAKTINVEVPFGTDVKNLTPTIIYAGKSCTPTGAQNFTGPVTYTVTALDDSSVNYTVTVTVQPIPEEYTTKSITAFSFLTTPVSIGIIDEEAKTISVEVPFGTDVKNLTPTIIYAGKSCTPTGAQNFTGPVTYTVTALDDSSVNYTVTVTVQPIPEEYTTKSITAFSFLTTPVSIGIIDEEAKTISVEVPFGTDVKNLTPTIIYAGKSCTPTGAQNFTGPVAYTVTALDDSSVNYTVTVTVQPIPEEYTTKSITAFTFLTTPVSIGIINEKAKTISVEVPFGTDVKNLTPTIIYAGKSYTPIGVQDFTGPVTYTVTALDDSSVEYTVTVTVKANSAKAITTFIFPTTPVSIGIINESTKTINVEVPFNTDVTNLTPTITHTGKSYTPTGAQDFTGPVIYTVTALDDSSVEYTVTVAVKAITAFTFPTNPISIGIIDEGAKTINVSVPFGTDVTKLTPSVIYKGISYSPTGQQNFTSPVTYAVTALNGSTVTYKVTVTVREPAQWARSTQTAPDRSVFNAVAVDNDGNVYAAGYQEGNGTFNYGDGVTAKGAYNASYNVVLVKYNSSGTALWARSTQTAPSESEFNAVAVDNDGNVYAAGYQDGGGTFNYGDGVTATGGYGYSLGNVVLVKYNSSGTALWARSTQPAPDYSRFNAVAVDNDGNVYAAGYQVRNGTFNYGDGVTATALWARSTQTAPYESRFNAVAVDNDGNVYAAGYQNDGGTFNYGDGVTATGGYDRSSIINGSHYNVVLVKYNSSGTALWARSTQTAPSESEFSAVAVDNAGNVYAAGYQRDSGTFNYGGDATAKGAYGGGTSYRYNVVLVKYNSSGTGLWARSTQVAPFYSQFRAVAVDNDGNVYAVGYQVNNGTFNFNYGGGATTANYANSYNVVLVKYNSLGTGLWARSTQAATNHSAFNAVTVDNNGNVYAAGYQNNNGTFNYGGDATTGGYYDGGYNVVLVKYRE